MPRDPKTEHDDREVVAFGFWIPRQVLREVVEIRAECECLDLFENEERESATQWPTLNLS